MTEPLAVQGFDDRSGGVSLEDAFGFIVFNDETRLVYAPSTDDVDDHGILVEGSAQLYGVTKTPGSRHIKLAHAYIEAQGLPVS